MKNLLIKASAGTLALFGLISCIDSRYDLANNELDMNISFGGDSLSLPVGSTGNTTLKDILKLEDNEYLRTDENGNYIIAPEAVDFSESVPVDNYSFRGDPAYLYLDFGSIPQTSGLPDEEFNYELPETHEVDVTFDDIEVDEIIERIDRIEFDAVAVVTVELATDAISRVRIDELSVIYPGWLLVESENPAKVSGEVTLDTPLVSTIDISGIDLHDYPEMFNPETHLLTIKDKIRTNCAITLFGGDISNEGGDILIDVTVNIVSPSGSDDIDVSAIEAAVSVATDPVTENFDLGLGGEEGLMSGEGILDLTGSSIYIDLSNGAPLAASFSGKIETFGKNGEKLAEVTFDTPEIAASSESHFVISQNGSAEGGYTGITVENFDDLFYRIPDNISITFNANSSSDCRIIPGSNYEISGTCRLETPVCFGPDLDMSVDYTIEDLQNKLEGYTNIIDGIIIEGKVVSTIPANATLSGMAVDINGNPIEGIDIFSADGSTFEIPYSPDAGNPAEISISLMETIDGAISGVNGIILTSRLYKGTGETVNTDNGVVFEDITLIIPGGVNIDLSEDTDVE